MEAFYEQLSLSTSQQSLRTDASKSVLLSNTVNTSLFPHLHTSIQMKDGKRFEGDGDVRRHVERLLLRLDFNGEFSKPKMGKEVASGILKQGGLT